MYWSEQVPDKLACRSLTAMLSNSVEDSALWLDSAQALFELGVF